MINLDQYLEGASPYDNAYMTTYDNGDVTLDNPLMRVGKSSSDKQHTVLEGETLQNIAYQYYRDSGLWYIIALANDILNPFEEVQSGQILRIPANG